MGVMAAHSWYCDIYINFQKRKLVYEQRNFDTVGIIFYKDWEILGSLLVDEHAKRGVHSDTDKVEIKSAVMGSGFEYQYCRESGLEKHDHDMSIDHLMISYSKDYRTIEGRLLLQEDAQSMINPWRDKIIKCYKIAQPKLRCRCSLTYKKIVNRGKLVFHIVNGELQHRPEDNVYSYICDYLLTSDTAVAQYAN